MTAAPQLHYIKANGLRLAYDEFGEHGKPAILLIMGLATQMTGWPEKFCRLLAGRGFRVIRFDNRDIGLSEKMHDAEIPNLFQLGLGQRLGLGLQVDVPYRLQDMAEDTVGILDALGIAAAHIVGVSMGGMIAQLVAGNYPQRTRSLTSIMSTSGHRSLPGPAPRVALHMFKPVGKLSEGEFLSRTQHTYRLIGSPGYPVKEEVVRQRILASYRRSYYPQGAARQAAAIAASGDRVKLLQDIRLPSLVVHGKEDVLVPVACGIDTAKRIAGARLELVDGMGHNLPPQLLPYFAQLIASHANEAELDHSTAGA